MTQLSLAQAADTKINDVTVTGETTTSASYVDLNTSGPSITLSSGITQNQLICHGAIMSNSSSYTLTSVSYSGNTAQDEDAASTEAGTRR